jgi:hypothetical protein
MKRKIIYIAIICVFVFVAFCVVEVLRSVKMIQADENNRQRLRKIYFIIMNYKEEHGKYPVALNEIVESSISTNQNALQIIQGNFNPNYSYQSKTNGFVFTATSSGSWLTEKTKYIVEYDDSISHSVLKINGTVSLESWAK